MTEVAKKAPVKRGCCAKKAKDPDAPPPAKMISYFKLFKYSSCADKLLVAVGVLMAILSGAVLPAIAIVVTNVIDAFDPQKTDEQMNEIIVSTLWIVLVFGSVLWVGGYFQYAFLQHMAEKLSFELRTRYLHSLMRQESAYFEKQ